MTPIQQSMAHTLANKSSCEIVNAASHFYLAKDIAKSANENVQERPDTKTRQNNAFLAGRKRRLKMKIAHRM